MAKIRLQRPRVVALAGQREAAAVPQHMGMGLEAEFGRDTGTLDHPGKARCGEWRATL